MISSKKELKFYIMADLYDESRKVQTLKIRKPV